MLLAIDTSTNTASLALLEDNKLVAELNWLSEQNHTTQLLTHINQLLKQPGVEIQDLSAVSVARGPGSFNGLRVGLGTAKGLALGLKIPLVGISTLEVEAYQHAEGGLPICPILNAGRGEIATAIYQRKGGRWRQLRAEHISTVKALGAEISGQTIFCGEFVEAIAVELKRMLGQKAIIPPPSGIQRASYLARLGAKRLAAGDSDDLASLQPLYLRRPSITKPKRTFRIALNQS